MTPAIRTAAPLLGIGLVALLIARMADLTTTETEAIFLPAAVLCALIAGLAAGVRRWRFLPWPAWTAVTGAAAAYLLNDRSWLIAGFFAFTVLLVWHEQQRERPRREAAARG